MENHELDSLEQEWLSESEQEGHIYRVWRKVIKDSVEKIQVSHIEGDPQKDGSQGQSSAFLLRQVYTEKVLQFSDKNWNAAEPSAK